MPKPEKKYYTQKLVQVHHITLSTLYALKTGISSLTRTNTKKSFFRSHQHDFNTLLSIIYNTEVQIIDHRSAVTSTFFPNTNTQHIFSTTKYH